ncbi:zinc finger MYM-type protein 1 [Diretmus argenteus]
MICWKSFRATEVQGNIEDQLLTANIGEVAERREYLRCIVAVTAFLAKQGLPFRGHREGEDSLNQGNFLETMKLLKQFDPFLQDYTAPSNAAYLSKDIQTQVIASCATVTTDKIVKEMTESKVYSVMADEARDGLCEQLSVCVRYIAPDGDLKERFLALKKLDHFDAESITNAIEEVLVSNGLDGLTCVAQAYDGASVMSGAASGVQARFREKHPQAVYVHCYAHDLNLVLCYTCKASAEAKAFFDLMESMYSFFHVSLVNHDKFAATQKNLGLDNSELVQLSQTRWACQLNSVKAMLRNFPAVKQTLESIHTPVAVGLRSKLCKFTTIYLLVMFKHLLSFTEGLHKYLQKETVDLAQAMQYKTAVYDTLKEQRTDQTAETIFMKSKAICEENHIPELSGSQRHNEKVMNEYVVESSCGARGSDVSTPEKLRQNVFFPCLDRMIQELDKRFSGVNAGLMMGIQACHPASEAFLSEESLRPLATHYGIQLQPAELLVAKQFLSKKTAQAIPDIHSVFKLLDVDMFPALKSVYQVALTIPVSSCSCERSFSALRRLHTWLRRTMGQDRLHQLALLSIEKGLLSELDHDKVIDTFAQLTNRRHSLLLPKT